MNTFTKSALVLATLGAAIALPSANAQLLLSGTAYGKFLNPGFAHTTVTNGPVVSLFESGIPFRPKKPYFDVKTSIKDTGTSFTGIDNGDVLNLGLLKMVNGITRIYTTAHSATMDLYLNMPGNGLPNFKLTTLLFTIVNTNNHGTKNVPDLFHISDTLVNPFKIHNRTVTLDLKFTNPAFSTGAGAPIGENQSATDGIYAIVHFSPVPEASTYALWGSALLVGVALTRRMRSSRSGIAV